MNEQSSPDFHLVVIHNIHARLYSFEMLSDAERAFIKELWGLQCASYAVVAARYYSRILLLGWNKLSWDDALMGLATVSHFDIPTANDST